VAIDVQSHHRFAADHAAEARAAQATATTPEPLPVLASAPALALDGWGYGAKSITLELELTAHVYDPTAEALVFRDDAPELSAMVRAEGEGWTLRQGLALTPDAARALLEGGGEVAVAPDAEGPHLLLLTGRGAPASAFRLTWDKTAISAVRAGELDMTFAGRAEAWWGDMAVSVRGPGRVSGVCSEHETEAEAEALLARVIPSFDGAAADRQTLASTAFRVEYTYRDAAANAVDERVAETVAVAERPPRERVTFPDGEGPTDPCPLVLEGRARRIERASLSISIHTLGWIDEAWAYRPEDPTVLYELMITVDERSGEDGAPAPDFSFSAWPMFQHPPLDDLTGLVLNEQSSGDFEAWFGNDAPSLDNNRVEVLGTESDGRLRVRWEAEYHDRLEGDPPRWGILPFLFEGLVDFSGVRVEDRGPRGKIGTRLARAMGRRAKCAGEMAVAARRRIAAVRHHRRPKRLQYQRPSIGTSLATRPAVGPTTQERGAG
jgi:hypothetical protein